MNEYFSLTAAPSRKTPRLFQERVLCLKLTVTALEFTDTVRVRHPGREGLAGYFLLVGLYPKPQGGIVDPDFPGDLGYRQRVIDHSLSGLLLELRSIGLASWHLIPFLSR
jgi:hypothetical protein